MGQKRDFQLSLLKNIKKKKFHIIDSNCIFITSDQEAVTTVMTSSSFYVTNIFSPVLPLAPLDENPLYLLLSSKYIPTRSLLTSILPSFHTHILVTDGNTKITKLMPTIFSIFLASNAMTQCCLKSFPCFKHKYITEGRVKIRTKEGKRLNENL